MRHQAEITAECTISVDSVLNRQNGFSVLPSKTDRLYILDALTREDRVCTQLRFSRSGYLDSLHSSLHIPCAAY